MCVDTEICGRILVKLTAIKYVGTNTHIVSLEYYSCRTRRNLMAEEVLCPNFYNYFCDSGN